MAEPLINPVGEIDAEAIAGKPERELPPAESELELPRVEPSINPRLNETAEAIGSALGNAARNIKEVRARFTVIRGQASESVTSKAEELKQAADEKLQHAKVRAGQAIEDVKQETVARIEDAKLRASRIMEDARDAAAERIEQARGRALHLADERPLTVLAGIAGVFFGLGIFLRVWRSNRD
jgi:hypothetical protein